MYKTNLIAINEVINRHNLKKIIPLRRVYALYGRKLSNGIMELVDISVSGIRYSLNGQWESVNYKQLDKLLEKSKPTGKSALKPTQCPLCGHTPDHIAIDKEKEN